MTYNEVSEFRISQTYQYSIIFIEKGFQQRRSHFGNNGEFWSFQKAGVQIYSRGTENKGQDADSRTEGSIYNKASQKPGFSYQTICKIYRGIIKQYSNTGPKGISEKKGAWPRGVVKERFRCFTVMIVWAIIRFHKFINYLFRRRFGHSVRMDKT
jgi:hypothetical protein